MAIPYKLNNVDNTIIQLHMKKEQYLPKQNTANYKFLKYLRDVMKYIKIIYYTT